DISGEFGDIRCCRVPPVRNCKAVLRGYSCTGAGNLEALPNARVLDEPRRREFYSPVSLLPGKVLLEVFCIFEGNHKCEFLLGLKRVSWRISGKRLREGFANNWVCEERSARPCVMVCRIKHHALRTAQRED